MSTRQCITCKKDKDPLEFRGDEQKCTECQVAALEHSQQKVGGGKHSDDHTTAERVQTQTQALYGSEEGLWMKCFVHSINAEGVCTISRVSEDGKPKPYKFKITSARMKVFNEELLNKEHELQLPESTAETAATDTAGHGLIAELLKQMKSQNQNNNYTEMIYWSSQIGKFKCDFPQNDASFYLWLTTVESFQALHDQCPEEMVFKKVVESLAGAELAAWREYRLAKYRDHLSSSTAQNTATIRKNFMKTMDTLPELEKFAIKRLQINPDISFFKRKMSLIRCRRDENPSDTLGRIEKFFFEYDTLRKKLNPHIQIKLRSISVTEKVDAIQRVLITENNSVENQNNGHLNAKVRAKLSKKWESLQKEAGDPDTDDYFTKHLREISKYIKGQLATECLPKLSEMATEDGKHWMKYGLSESLFKLQSRSTTESLAGKKHPRDEDMVSAKYNAQPPRKQVKVSKVKPCRWGAECRRLLEGKRCRRFHTENEKIAVQRKRMEQQQTEIDAKSNAQPRSPHSSDQRSQADCRRGKECPYWQNGVCNYRHVSANMRCRNCRQIGHPAVACKSKQSGVGQQKPARYSVNNVNHPRSQSNQAMMMHQDSTNAPYATTPAQFIDKLSSSIPTTRELVDAKRAMQQSSLEYRMMKARFKGGSGSGEH